MRRGSVWAALTVAVSLNLVGAPAFADDPPAGGFGGRGGGGRSGPFTPGVDGNPTGPYSPGGPNDNRGTGPFTPGENGPRGPRSPHGTTGSDGRGPFNQPSTESGSGGGFGGSLRRGWNAVATFFTAVGQAIWIYSGLRSLFGGGSQSPTATQPTNSAGVNVGRGAATMANGPRTPVEIVATADRPAMVLASSTLGSAATSEVSTPRRDGATFLRP